MERPHRVATADTRPRAGSSAGASLAGSYTHLAGNRALQHGAVEDTGTIRSLALDNATIVFSSNTLDGNGVSADASALKLIVRWGSADGLTLRSVRQ